MNGFIKAIYVFAITTIIMFIILGVSSLFTKQSKIDDTWVKSVCEVSSVIGGKGSNIKINYWVKDSLGIWRIVKDKFTNEYLYKAAVGDKFIMWYNSNNIEEFYIEIWKPVFLESENKEKEYSVCEITRNPYQLGFSSKSKSKSTHGIEFKYRFNNKEYSKSQHLPPNFKELYPKIEKGAIYKVLIWTLNPQRALISNEDLKNVR